MPNQPTTPDQGEPMSTDQPDGPEQEQGTCLSCGVLERGLRQIVDTGAQPRPGIKWTHWREQARRLLVGLSKTKDSRSTVTNKVATDSSSRQTPIGGSSDERQATPPGQQDQSVPANFRGPRHSRSCQPDHGQQAPHPRPGEGSSEEARTRDGVRSEAALADALRERDEALALVEEFRRATRTNSVFEVIAELTDVKIKLLRAEAERDEARAERDTWKEIGTNARAAMASKLYDRCAEQFIDSLDKGLGGPQILALALAANAETVADRDRQKGLYRGAQEAIDRAWAEIPFGSESPNDLTEEVRALVAERDRLRAALGIADELAEIAADAGLGTAEEAEGACDSIYRLALSYRRARSISPPPTERRES